MLPVIDVFAFDALDHLRDVVLVLAELRGVLDDVLVVLLLAGDLSADTALSLSFFRTPHAPRFRG